MLQGAYAALTEATTLLTTLEQSYQAHLRDAISKVHTEGFRKGLWDFLLDYGREGQTAEERKSSHAKLTQKVNTDGWETVLNLYAQAKAYQETASRPDTLTANMHRASDTSKNSGILSTLWAATYIYMHHSESNRPR